MVTGIAGKLQHNHTRYNPRRSVTYTLGSRYIFTESREHRAIPFYFMSPMPLTPLPPSYYQSFYSFPNVLSTHGH